MSIKIRIVLIVTLGFTSVSPGVAQVIGDLESPAHETYGAWQVICRVPPGMEDEKCALTQRVTAQHRQNLLLTVLVYMASDDDKTLLRAVVPLGVLLPAGLALKIDGQDIGTAPFLKCTKRGCAAEVTLKKETIGKLKKGQSALLIIFDTPKAGIGIPVSLNGFVDALSRLK